MSGMTQEDLVRDLKAMGLQEGDLVNVKASLRAIGKIEGGVDTLINALLAVVGSRGTIVTDSFVDVFSPLRAKFWTNVVDENTKSYAGGLANAMLKRPEVRRSQHPVQKFAIIGHLASDLAEGHTADSYAYDVLRIMAEKGGKNLKIGPDEKVPGVGTTHVAIGLEKLRQKRSWVGVRYKDKSGEVRSFYRNWSGGCMKAFFNLNPLYDQRPGAVISKGRIGDAPAKLTSMSSTLTLERELIRRDVRSFLRCGDPNCVECKFSWEFCQDSLPRFVLDSLGRGDFKKTAKAIVYRLFYRYPFSR